VISFSDDYNTLYRNQGGGALYDVTHQAGLEQAWNNPPSHF